MGLKKAMDTPSGGVYIPVHRRGGASNGAKNGVGGQPEGKSWATRCGRVKRRLRGWRRDWKPERPLCKVSGRPLGSVRRDAAGGPWRSAGCGILDRWIGWKEGMRRRRCLARKPVGERGYRASAHLWCYAVWTKVRNAQVRMPG